jgi:hypothetical protein
MSGFGNSAFGTSVFGYGTSMVTTIPKTTFLIQADNKTPGNDLAIDPITGDYILNGQDQFVGASEIANDVYYALATKFGSGILPQFGLNLSSVTLITSNIQIKVNAAVKSALSNLISSSLISLNSVSIQLGNIGVLNIQVSWTDTSNNIIQTTTIPIIA